MSGAIMDRAFHVAYPRHLCGSCISFCAAEKLPIINVHWGRCALTGKDCSEKSFCHRWEAKQ